MRQLLTIGGKQYLLEVGSQVEPPYVGDKNAVDFFAWIPNPHDPLNDFEKNIKHTDQTNYYGNNTDWVRSKRLDFTPNPSNTAEYDADILILPLTTYLHTSWQDKRIILFK